MGTFTPGNSILIISWRGEIRPGEVFGTIFHAQMRSMKIACWPFCHTRNPLTPFQPPATSGLNGTILENCADTRVSLVAMTSQCMQQIAQAYFHSDHSQNINLGSCHSTEQITKIIILTLQRWLQNFPTFLIDVSISCWMVGWEHVEGECSEWIFLFSDLMIYSNETPIYIYLARLSFH